MNSRTLMSNAFGKSVDVPSSLKDLVEPHGLHVYGHEDTLILHFASVGEMKHVQVVAAALKERIPHAVPHMTTRAYGNRFSVSVPSHLLAEPTADAQ
jgi:3-deoxy-D-manno-octulosonic-acid transferase